MTMAAATSLALFAPPTSAHVTIEPPQAPAGKFQRFNLQVLNESERSSTIEVDLQLPPAVTAVLTEPAQSWRLSVRRTKLAKPIEMEGERITERVSRVTWKGEGPGGDIGPDQFRDFGLLVLVPGEPGKSLAFKVLQKSDDGGVVRWIGPPDSDEPAPRVKVVSQRSAAASASRPGTSSSGSDDDSDTVAVIALVASVVALLIAGGTATLARRRR